jgi:hypothetical protein
VGVPTLVVSGLPYGSSGTKSHLDVAFAERCIIYYMREGGGFPRVRVVVNLVSLKSFVAYPSHQRCSNIVLTNMLVGFDGDSSE